MNIKRTIKLSFLLLAVMVLTMAIYGFAAANTVPASKAGDGQEVISGYTITNVHYNLDAATPSLITGMTFTLDAAPATTNGVYVKLISTGVNYTSCVATGANVACTFTPAISVLSADQLRVIAAQ